MVRRAIVMGVLLVGLLVGTTACQEVHVSAAHFASELVHKAQLTPVQAQCVVRHVYRDFSQHTIDLLYTANSAAELPPGVEQSFEAIVSLCVTGH